MRDWNKEKEICSKATRGPWKWYEQGIGTEWEHPQLKAPAPIITTATGIGGVSIYIEPKNADFITTARTALPEAIAEIEQLRAENKRKGELIAYWACDVRKEEADQHKAEIEQLRQDNAELVDALKDLVRIRDHFIDKRDFDLLESLPDTWERAKELIVKLGGAK